MNKGLADVKSHTCTMFSFHALQSQTLYTSSVAKLSLFLFHSKIIGGCAKFLSCAVSLLLVDVSISLRYFKFFLLPTFVVISGCAEFPNH